MFEVTTQYDKKAMLAMNRAANKTFRRGSYLFHKILQIVLGLWCLIAGGLLLLIFDKLDTGARIIAAAAPVVGALTLLRAIFYNRLSARASRRQMIEGSSQWSMRFGEEEFAGENADGVRSAYPYSKIQAVYETSGYFLLQIDKLHCVVLDKAGFTKGQPAAFRMFISGKTGKAVQNIT